MSYNDYSHYSHACDGSLVFFFVDADSICGPEITYYVNPYVTTVPTLWLCAS